MITLPNNHLSTESVLKQSNEELFVRTMKKIAIQRDEDVTTLEACDFDETVKYFDFSGTDVKVGESSLERQFYDLWQVDDSQHSVRLSKDLRAMMAELIRQGVPAPQYGNILQTLKMQNLYRSLKDKVCQTVPAQQKTIEATTADLTMQLCNTDNVTAKRLLLHSNHGGGALEVAEAMADQLSELYGYEPLKIDCSNYRSAGEASSWTGSKSYWSGSTSGEITSHIHEHPKSVIILNRLDETLPQIMDSLRDAFTKGVLVDNHGINNEEMSRRKDIQPTVIDCKDVVFIATVSHGYDWLEHPDSANILGDSDEQKKKNLFNELRSAERNYRGAVVPKFSSVILDYLEGHYHILEPLSWSVLVDEASHSIQQLAKYHNQQTGKQLMIKIADTDLAELALLQRGDEIQIVHTQLETLYQQIIEPMSRQQFDNDIIDSAKTILDMTTEEFDKLQEIKQRLGNNPKSLLQKRKQFVDFQITMDKANNNIAYIHNIQLKNIQKLTDYTDGGLISELPTEKFADICGHKKVINYFKEMITYLKNPSAVKKLNIKLPKGCLLYGPPGTGKTMLAKALAGEADIPFVATSGSDLLNSDNRHRIFGITARSAPCVLFIDEADALGSRLDSSLKNVAINELLTHIDGFHNKSQLFVIMASNHPNMIDRALLRPGRVDTYFEINQLDAIARNRYLSSKLWRLAKLSKEEKQRIIKHTSGFTGAELEQLTQSIGLRLIRENRKKASFDWVMKEITKMQYGDNSDYMLTDDFRYATAVHEAGHAVLQHLYFPNRPLAQVSIIPNAHGAAGYTAWTREENTLENHTIATIKQEMQVDLGGRAAEILYFGEEGKCLGSSSDLTKASARAFMSITQSGLDEEFGAVSIDSLAIKGNIPEYLHTLAVNRTKAWIDEASTSALATLTEHKEMLDSLVDALLEKEVLDDSEILTLLSHRQSDKSPTK